MSTFFSNKKNYLLEIFLDILLFALAYILAFTLRYGREIPEETWAIIKSTLPFVLLIRTAIFFLLKVFSGQWRYCSIVDVVVIFRAITLGSVITAIMIYLLDRFQNFPQTVIVIEWLLVTVLIGFVRFSKRLIKELLINKTNNMKKVLIIGAGRVGKSLIYEMRTSWELGYRPVALIDDDPTKLNQAYYGVKVYGTRMSITHIVERMNIDEIVIALPHTTGKDLREIISCCRMTGKPLKIVTKSDDPNNKKNLENRLRNINIEDLIGRKVTKTEYDTIKQFIEGKRVLVTGAAGSIGSELCRQIAALNPERLIALDRSENGLFYLDRELTENFQNLVYSLTLADITDAEETNNVFYQYNPHIVFHAAAYKHVPMMELNPQQAIKNNIIGTKNVVDIAMRHNVRKFVLISTDKAVRPSNFMGMTKRIAEQYVQVSNHEGKTKCVAVRFGNVIGSSGSVIKIFEEQIDRGGPLTVTHPDVARFFMTIPEAVHLVLQAANMGKGGEIFVLKMGEMVKIYDLAKELILLAGKEPHTDIKINFTGLRPGEKIVEELWENTESCSEDLDENLYVIRNGIADNLTQYQKKIEHILAATGTMNMNFKGLKTKLESIMYASN